MEINGQTKLADILAEYPFMKTGMAEINGKFRMLQTPMGKVMVRKATVADMSERSGMPVDELAAAIAAKVGAAQGSPDGSDPAANSAAHGEPGAGSPDGDLADLAVEFWDLTWNDDRRHLPQETRLLLSMANALGAGRMRQASRELIKVYALGCDSGALDDVMELVAWNQGIGTFASEVGPSTFFRAYRTVKEQEAKGKPRSEIVGMLMERFGEQNPDVGVQ